MPKLEDFYKAFAQGVLDEGIIAESIMIPTSDQSMSLHLKYKYPCAPRHVEKLKSGLRKAFEEVAAATYQTELKESIIKIEAMKTGLLLDAWCSFHSDDHTLDTAKKLGVAMSKEIMEMVQKLKTLSA